MLTTHYLEEAEELADRIGILRKGKLLLVEDRATMMARGGGAQSLEQIFVDLIHSGDVSSAEGTS